jgi:hypothetical protein
MSLQLPFGVRVLNPLPVEDKYLNNGVPYTGTSQVNTLVTSGVRFIGLTVNINNVEYWYATGTSDGSLIVKSPSVVSGGGITGATNGLTKTGANVKLGGTLTGNTTIAAAGKNLIIGSSSSKIGNYSSYISGNSYINYNDGTNNLSQFLSSSNAGFQGSFGAHSFNLNYDTTSNGLILAADSNNVALTYNDVTVTLGGTNKFVYAADYSANFSKYSLVDKHYVTGLTSTISVPVTGATNGLSVQGKNVVLGGTMTGDTTIDGAGFTNLLLGGINGFNNIQLSSNNGVGFYTQNSNVSATAGNGSIQLSANQGSNFAEILVSAANNQFKIQDGRTGGNAVGIEYAANYSANFTPRSLVDKAYVTGLTTSSGVQTVNNGLTKTGTNAQLGGSLVAATTITISSGNTLSFAGYPAQYATDLSSSYVARSIPDKAYVDSIAAGFDPKQAAFVATVSALTGATYHATGGTTSTGSFTSAPTIVDGITLSNGKRILVKNQIDPKQNGIYTVITGGTWYRSSDMDGTPANEVAAGDYLFVQTGATQAATGWVLTGDGVLTINTDPLNFVQFSAANAYIAGSGISIVGNTISNTGVITANNGLTKSGSNVHLGGSLTGDTIIDGASGTYSLSLGNSVNPFKKVEIYGDNGVTIQSATGTGNSNIYITAGNGIVAFSGNNVTADSPLFYKARVTDHSTYNNTITLNSVGTHLVGGNNSGSLAGTLNLGIGGNATLSGFGNGYETDFIVIGTGITITSQYPSFNGAQYANDYSSNFTDRSLIDKGYAIGLISMSASTTASNGINKNGNDFRLGGALTEYTAIDGSNTYALDLFNLYGFTAQTSGSMSFASSGNFGLNVMNNIIVTSQNQYGIQYAADYSANYQNRSLVDKAYVTGLTTSGITTANNGLVKSGNNVHLGGSLTGDTIIDGGMSVYKLQLGNFSSNPLAQFNVNVRDGISLYTSVDDASIVKVLGNVVGITGQSNGDIFGSAAIIASETDQSLLAKIEVGAQYLMITDNRTFVPQKGIEYAADYSANFTPRSLVDKGYLTGFTASLALTDGNGTTANGTAVDLGGTLNNNVNIDGGYDINIGLDTPINSLNVLSENIGGTGLSLRANSNFAGTHYVQIYTDNDSNLMYLSAVDSGGETTIRLGSSSNPTQIYSTYSGFQGLMYDQDYSPNFNARSLPDVAFVTGVTFSASTLQGAYVTDPSYTMSASTSFVGVSGSTTGVTVYLPASPVIYRQYIVSDIAGNAFMDNITVDGNGKLIQGSSTAVINTDYGSVTFVYNGFNWSVVAIV